MNRRSIKVQSFIIFTSIITIGLEFGCYYFLNTLYGGMVIAVLLNLILSHFFLETSLTYSSCFIQSITTVLLSTGATIFIYIYQTGNLLIYDKNLSFLILLNWFTPLLYSIIRNFMDHGPKFVTFRSYFWKTSILFSAYYIFFFVLHYFFIGSSFPIGKSIVSNPLIPFLSTATYIEDCIYLGQPLFVLLVYVFKTILIFAPIGFYASILLKEASRKIILILTFLLPLIPEFVSFFQTNVFNMDAYLYNLLGFLFGMMIYQLLNSISHHCLNTDFLADRNKYSFFNFYF